MKKALVLSLAAVLGLGFASFAQTLSGSWDTTVTIQPSPVLMFIDSELVVEYAVSGWTFTSTSAFDETGWLEQSFAAEGSLGAFSIGSELVFDPVGVAFTSWEVTGGLSLAGVTFDLTFTLADLDTTLEIVGSGSAGLVDVGVTLTLGGDDNDICDFLFGGVDITVDFPFCCAEVESTISFDCTGFVEATFAVSGIAIPTLPWVTIDALLTFTMEEKTLDLDANFDFGAIACFELYISQAETGNLVLGDITISGIGLSCEIGGVEFYGLSYWAEDAGKPAILGDYWEMYQISTTDDGCCGPFDFSIAVFFDATSAELFDVSLIEASMSIQVATQFTFSTGISIDLALVPAFTEWTIGFLVEW